MRLLTEKLKIESLNVEEHDISYTAILIRWFQMQGGDQISELQRSMTLQVSSGVLTLISLTSNTVGTKNNGR